MYIEVLICVFISHSPTSAVTKFLLLALRVSFLSQPPQPSMSHLLQNQTSRLQRLKSHRPRYKGERCWWMWSLLMRLGEKGGRRG